MRVWRPAIGARAPSPPYLNAHNSHITFTPPHPPLTHTHARREDKRWRRGDGAGGGAGEGGKEEGGKEEAYVPSESGCG